jgi:hypothetical protein
MKVGTLLGVLAAAAAMVAILAAAPAKAAAVGPQTAISASAA